MTRGSGASAKEDPFRSRWFVWAALAAAVLPGFGAGAALFAALTLGWPLEPWWPALAQMHGASQLFGFAGCMVFGVAFHFLPRLRGAPLVAGRATSWTLALYGGGLLLRVLTQGAGPFLPATNAAGGGLLIAAVRGGFVVSGPITLVGAAVGIFALVQNARHGPPVRSRAGFAQVLPLLAVGATSFVVALGLNAAGTLATIASPIPPTASGAGAAWLVPAPIDGATVRVALLGWLVPVAVAFSARNFPLFIRTRPASARALNGGLGLLLLGLAADLAGRIGWREGEVAGGVGLALEGMALAWLTACTGALGAKVPFRGRISDPAEAALARASAWPLIGAYAWLTLAGALLFVRGVALAFGWPPPEDAERHALAAGFVFLLVVGMALRLLPGFAGGARRSVGLTAAWGSIWAAHLAALLRVLPIVLSWLASLASPGGGGSVPGASAALSLAGVVGMVSIVFLVVSLRVPLGLSAPPARAERRAAGRAQANGKVVASDRRVD